MRHEPTDDEITAAVRVLAAVVDDCADRGLPAQLLVEFDQTDEATYFFCRLDHVRTAVNALGYESVRPLRGAGEDE